MVPSAVEAPNSGRYRKFGDSNSSTVAHRAPSLALPSVVVAFADSVPKASSSALVSGRRQARKPSFWM